MGSGFTCRGFLRMAERPLAAFGSCLMGYPSFRLRTAPHFAFKNSAMERFAFCPRSAALERPSMPQRSLLSPVKLAAIAFCVLAPPSVLAAQATASAPPDIVAGPQVIFQGQQDVGTVLHAGSAQYDGATGTYTVSGSGENMWFSSDDFHFVWTKVSGDVALTADIAILGSGGDPHRKAVLMIRQSLDGNSAAVDLAVHGSVSLPCNFATRPAASTTKCRPMLPPPKRCASRNAATISTPSSRVTMASWNRGRFHQGRADGRRSISGSASARTTRMSSSGRLSPMSTSISLPPATGTPVLVSALETIPIASTDRHVEYVAAAHFEAPNWSRDGSSLLFNQDNRIFRLALAGGQPAAIETAPELHLQQRSRHLA